MIASLWARLRGLSGKRNASRQLEQILAGWRSEERPENSGFAVKRELLHPMKGWVVDGADRAANDRNLQWKVRHPAHVRTRAR